MHHLRGVKQRCRIPGQLVAVERLKAGLIILISGSRHHVIVGVDDPSGCGRNVERCVQGGEGTLQDSWAGRGGIADHSTLSHATAGAAGAPAGAPAGDAHGSQRRRASSSTMVDPQDADGSPHETGKPEPAPERALPRRHYQRNS